MFKNLKENNNLSWPTADIKYLNKDDITIVIQVNGKKGYSKIRAGSK